ncbi:MAG: GAF domain-containing protein, partial [Myxococcales bacterium]
GRAIGSSLDLDHVLRVVVAETTRLLEAERSTLYLVDRARGEIWSRVVQGEGLKEIRQPLTRGLAGWVCTHGEPVNVPDVSKDARFNPEVDRATGFRTRSMLVVPLRDSAGAVVGAIQVLNRRHSVFGTEDEATLGAIAAQAAVALENTHLFSELTLRNAQLSKAQEDLASRVAELDLLVDVERLISAASSTEDVLDAVLGRAMERLRCEAGSVLLLEEETGELLFKSALGEKGEEVKTFRLELGEGIAGEVARTGRPIVTNDAPKHPAWSARIARRTGVPVRAVLCVPLHAGGRVAGALELLGTRGGRSFDEGDLRLATLVAGQLGRAVELGRGREERERRERLAIIGQMISGMLHDLRTPMTIVSGYAQLMAEEPDAAERGRSAEI